MVMDASFKQAIELSLSEKHNRPIVISDDDLQPLDGRRNSAGVYLWSHNNEQHVITIRQDDRMAHRGFNINAANKYHSFLLDHGYTHVPDILEPHIPLFTEEDELLSAKITEYIEGCHLNSLNTEQARALGKELAQQHNLGIEFIDNERFYLDTTPSNFHLSDTLENYHIDYGRTLQNAKYFNRLNRDDIPYAMTHGDLSLSNIIFKADNNTEMYFIDFEKTRIRNCIDSLTKTMCITCPTTDVEQTSDNMQAFIEGYESVRELENREKELFPDALMKMYAWDSLFAEGYLKKNFPDEYPIKAQKMECYEQAVHTLWPLPS